MSSRCASALPRPGAIPERNHHGTRGSLRSEPVRLREALQAFWAERNAMIIAADPEPESGPDPEPEPDVEAGS
jgi:hypothetical protein